MRHDLLCYAYPVGERWEAICVDLDIAIEAESLPEAQATLRDAIRSYIEAAMEEEPETRKKLLSRRAPWSVRLKLWLAFQLQLLRRRASDRSLPAVFGVPCPA
ncbi:MAG: hypothetical protein ACK4MT_10195 [Thermaurantiacus tibetensis]|uniref:hypothetical protein n=1 Tax=Thermaurantiacus tibetensis TaxID=2759035 RepID=UPI00188DED64|nr:hypothetical protein [Thermaurantiacus tibetensis]